MGETDCTDDSSITKPRRNILGLNPIPCDEKAIRLNCGPILAKLLKSGECHSFYPAHCDSVTVVSSDDEVIAFFRNVV